MSDARSFREAEQMTAAVVPHGKFLTLDLLKQTLDAWVENSQCREASSMPDLAAALFCTTAHLRPNDLGIWLQFLGERP